MNYENVTKIIEERFSLGEDGFNSFVKNLNLEVPEYSFLDKEGRKCYKIDPSLYPYVDDGYSILTSLNSFVERYNISFQDYSINKVSIKGNSVKLFKAAVDYYGKEVTHNWKRYDFSDERAKDLSFVEKFAKDTGCNFVEAFRLFNKIYKPSEIKAFRTSFSEKEETVEDAVSFILQKIFEKIGCFKVNTTKELYFVISKNFNDYFLCSNGEGWTSCLNPESPSGFWSALPFLVSDPNRCLCIISDLTEKEYLGIKSIRMFKRGWGELDKSGIINTGMFYPAKEYINSDFFLLMKLQEPMKSISQSFNSKYPINLFYNKYNVFDFLYQDDTYFNFIDENVCFLKRGTKNHTIIVKNGGTRDYHMCSYKEGLTKLIEENKSIEEFPGQRFCPDCLNILDENEKICYTLEDGTEKAICTNCFSKLPMEMSLKCSCCGKPSKKSLMRISRGTIKDKKIKGLICNECIECARCSELISKENIVLHGGHKVCASCNEAMSRRNPMEEIARRNPMEEMARRNPIEVMHRKLSSDRPQEEENKKRNPWNKGLKLSDLAEVSIKKPSRYEVFEIERRDDDEDRNERDEDGEEI